MQVFSYKTIQLPVEGSYKEKGSKFLAFAYPVTNEEEVKEKLTLLKKEYFDARHHCFAFVLEPDKKKFRAFDDGEPNHAVAIPFSDRSDQETLRML
jgi:putative IMPACT (imprinted ancient) family translation regulator